MNLKLGGHTSTSCIFKKISMLNTAITAPYIRKFAHVGDNSIEYRWYPIVSAHHSTLSPSIAYIFH